MDKFTSIINYNHSLLSEDEASARLAAYSNRNNLPTKEQSVKTSKEPSESDGTLPLPPAWSKNEMSGFLDKLSGGDYAGALGILVGDTSLSDVFNVEKIRNTLEVPLNNVISSLESTVSSSFNSVNPSGEVMNTALKNERNTSIGPAGSGNIKPDFSYAPVGGFKIPDTTINSIPQSTQGNTYMSALDKIAPNVYAPTPEQLKARELNPTIPSVSSQEIPEQEDDIAQEFGNIINSMATTVGTISEKLKMLVSEPTMSKVVANFKALGDIKELHPEISKFFDDAENSSWQDDLQSLFQSTASHKSKLPVPEHFDIIISDYKNLNQLNEVAPVAVMGLGAIIGIVAKTFIAHFITETAVSFINLFGFMIARAITMPLRILLVIIDKLKKYKNFLLGIFMPVQIISGVIINSGDKPGQFTGPMMQEYLQKLTDFAIEIFGDVMQLLGLDVLIQHVKNSGKGLVSTGRRALTHVIRKIWKT